MSGPTRPSLPATDPAIIAFASGLAALMNRDGVRERFRSAVTSRLSDSAQPQTPPHQSDRIARTYQVPDGVVPGARLEPARPLHRPLPLPIERDRAYEPEDCMVILAAIHDAVCHESEPVIVRPGGEYDIVAIPHRGRWEVLTTRHVPALTAADVPDLTRYLQSVERFLTGGTATEHAAGPGAEAELPAVLPPSLSENQRRVIDTLAEWSTDRLGKVEDIADSMSPAVALSPRTIRPIVNELISRGLAERPQGERCGCRLTVAGRKMASTATAVGSARRQVAG
jgi:hypothetical protein